MLIFSSFFSSFQTSPIFKEKILNNFWLSIFSNPSWVQCTNQFLSTTTQTRLCSHFHHFLALSRPYPFFRKKFRIFFVLASGPILAEFNAPISFCPWLPRLDLCSYFYHFWALSRPHQFLRKIFWNFFVLVSSPILAEFNAPISFCPRPPRLYLCSYFHHFWALFRPHRFCWENLFL
jgi:hypothetical protein